MLWSSEKGLAHVLVWNRRPDMFYSQQDCKHLFLCFVSYSSLEGYWLDRVHHSQIFFYLCYMATHLNRLFFGFCFLQVYYICFSYISGTVEWITTVIPYSSQAPRQYACSLDSDQLLCCYAPTCAGLHCHQYFGYILWSVERILIALDAFESPRFLLSGDT